MRKTEDRRYEVLFNCDVRISGDILLMFYMTKNPKGVSIKRNSYFILKNILKLRVIFKGKLCHVWFNTNFVDNTGILRFKKYEIDKAHKDKKHLVFPVNFTIQINLTEVNEEIEGVIQEARRLHYDPPFTNF